MYRDRCPLAETWSEDPRSGIVPCCCAVAQGMGVAGAVAGIVADTSAQKIFFTFNIIIKPFITRRLH